MIRTMKNCQKLILMKINAVISEMHPFCVPNTNCQCLAKVFQGWKMASLSLKSAKDIFLYEVVWISAFFFCLLSSNGLFLALKAAFKENEIDLNLTLLETFDARFWLLFLEN